MHQRGEFACALWRARIHYVPPTYESLHGVLRIIVVPGYAVVIEEREHLILVLVLVLVLFLFLFFSIRFESASAASVTHFMLTTWPMNPIADCLYLARYRAFRPCASIISSEPNRLAISFSPPSNGFLCKSLNHES
jgi:hypothetical protein